MPGKYFFLFSLDGQGSAGYILFVGIQPGEAMRSQQEIFDFVLTSLKNQGKQSISRDGLRCMLRGQDRTKCAIGFLIHDIDYRDDFDKSIFLRSDLAKSFPEIYDNLEFMFQLKRIHDHFYHWALKHERIADHPFSADGIRAIKKVAEDYGLRVPDWI